MSRLRIAHTLVTQTAFDIPTMYAIYQATMRARRYINLHGLAAPRRIVLRADGTVRAEINTGKCYPLSATVVAVVNR